MLEPVVPSHHPRSSDLASLRAALERCWCADTSFWPDAWTPERPSHGQCAVTALIVHDRFGGVIRRATNEGVLHYWNAVDGVEVDLTRDQFEVWEPDEPITTVARSALIASGPTLAERRRVLTDLVANSDQPPRHPG